MSGSDFINQQGTNFGDLIGGRSKIDVGDTIDLVAPFTGIGIPAAMLKQVADGINSGRRESSAPASEASASLRRATRGRACWREVRDSPPSSKAVSL